MTAHANSAFFFGSDELPFETDAAAPHIIGGGGGSSSTATARQQSQHTTAAAAIATAATTTSMSFAPFGDDFGFGFSDFGADAIVAAATSEGPTMETGGFSMGMGFGIGVDDGGGFSLGFGVDPFSMSMTSDPSLSVNAASSIPQQPAATAAAPPPPPPTSTAMMLTTTTTTATLVTHGMTTVAQIEVETCDDDEEMGGLFGGLEDDEENEFVDNEEDAENDGDGDGDEDDEMEVVAVVAMEMADTTTRKKSKNSKSQKRSKHKHHRRHRRKHEQEAAAEAENDEEAQDGGDEEKEGDFEDEETQDTDDASASQHYPAVASAPSSPDAATARPNTQPTTVGGRTRHVSSIAVDSSIQALRSVLSSKRNASNAAGQEQYMKGMVRFYGIKTPELKPLFNSVYASRLGKLTSAEQIVTAYRLMEGEYMEEKACAVMLLVKNVRHMGEGHLAEIGAVVDAHVHEWATCDSIAAKVINSLVKRDERLARVVAQWKDSGSTWRMRCCCVAFVKIARFGRHTPVIVDICRACIRRTERFVQLGVGWLLRELSIAELDLVVDFIKQNYEHFTREGLRYAIEKMKSDLRKELLSFKAAATNANPVATPAPSLAAAAKKSPSPIAPAMSNMGTPAQTPGVVSPTQPSSATAASSSTNRKKRSAPTPTPSSAQQQSPASIVAQMASPQPITVVAPTPRSSMSAASVAAAVLRAASSTPPPCGLTVAEYQQAMQLQAPRASGFLVEQQRHLLAAQQQRSQSMSMSTSMLPVPMSMAMQTVTTSVLPTSPVRRGGSGALALSATRFHPYQQQQQQLARQLSMQQQIQLQHQQTHPGQAPKGLMFPCRSPSPCRSPPPNIHTLGRSSGSVATVTAASFTAAAPMPPPMPPMPLQPRSAAPSRSISTPAFSMSPAFLM